MSTSRQQTLQQNVQHQKKSLSMTHEENMLSRIQETIKFKSMENVIFQGWIVQCGSFKGFDQAESVRAALAFEGFESQLNSSGGWNRVVIGPFKDRASANSMLKRLRNSGYLACLRLISGG